MIFFENSCQNLKKSLKISFFNVRIYERIQYQFGHMIKINPLKHLSGKLSHLQITQNRYLRIFQLINSVRSSTNSSAFQQATPESILALRSKTHNLDQRLYHKFQFDYQVHKEAALFSTPSTIFDELNPHERKMSHLFTTYLGKLNSPQLLYLHLAIRKKINSQFFGWHNVHINPESPSKGQFEVMPTLESASLVPALKILPKKKVMKQVFAMKEKL